MRVSIQLKSAISLMMAYAGLRVTRVSLQGKLLLCLVAAYLPSYIDGSEYRAAPRRSKAFSAAVRAIWRKVLPSIFRIRPALLEAPEALADCKQYILAIHPHGVLSLDHLLTLVSFDPTLEQVAPQGERSALSAGILFKIPFIREAGLWLGCVDASRATATRCLQKGLSLSVVPGGEREQLLSQRGSVESLILKRRQGFVKLALQHGIPLVPVYCFGENQLYHQSTFMMRFRSWVQRSLGIALVMPYGRFGVPWVPCPTPLQLVVGAPIQVPTIKEPSHEEVDMHHQRYMAELTNLFLRHRETAGYGELTLEML